MTWIVKDCVQRKLFKFYFVSLSVPSLKNHLRLSHLSYVLTYVLLDHGKGSIIQVN